MSVELMSLVMKADLGTVGLGPLDKALLLMLADQANPDEEAELPRVKWLANVTGLSVRSVQRSLRRLVDANLIVIEKAGMRTMPKPFCFTGALGSVPQWKLHERPLPPGRGEQP